MKTMNHWRIIYWIARARSAKKKGKGDRAWAKALALAGKTRGWLVIDCEGRKHGGEHPIEVTRITSGGTVYGRKHYRRGKKQLGSESAWVKP